MELVPQKIFSQNQQKFLHINCAKKKKGIGTVMAEKTQVYHFAPGMPYIPPKDFRLARAKWESQKLYINGLPAFFHLHLQREKTSGTCIQLEG